MINPQLVASIRDQHASGIGRTDITNNLVSQGWTLADINEAFSEAVPDQSVTAQGVPTASTPAPSIQDASSSASPVSHRVSFRVWIGGILAAIIIALGGGLAYAYTQHIGPFAQIPYTQENLLSGILATSKDITSSAYAINAELAVGPRDEGAVPFSIKTSNSEDLAIQYQNDSTRAKDISAFLSALQMEGEPYPQTLEQVVEKIKKQKRSYVYFSEPSLSDPTGKKYEYTATNGGKNFALTATFQTYGALKSIRYSRVAATSTMFNGKTVTFTKDSSSYLYVSSDAPKPFLVSLGEMMRLLPAEVSVSFGITAATDVSNEASANWKFGVDASGDFGDLTYKVNAEALKKDKDYYFRINNIPSIFGSELATIKGQWVKINGTAATSSRSSGGALSYLSSHLSEMESSYKKNRAQSAESIRLLASFADEAKLLTFKKAPRSEKVGDRLLYRYDLEVSKDAILSFYKKVEEEAAKNPSLKDIVSLDDPGMIEYLQSDEFSQVFDYYNKNTSLTLWVDSRGFPAQVEYTMRVIPPDTATQLAQKQVNITWRLVMSDINKPANISTPENAKPIEELIEAVSKNVDYSIETAQTKGVDAAIKANLSNNRVAAETYHDTQGSYGTQTWTVGAATSCTGGVFKDATVAKNLAASDATNGTSKNIACYAYGTGYVMGADLVAGGWWCVDSSGNVTVESGSLPTTAPKSKLCP